MAQSLAKIILHIVFSTKNRSKLILDEFEPELHSYLAKVCHNLGCYVYRVGGTQNHIHIACTLPRAISAADLLENLKTGSSRWMKTKSPRCSNFAWQNGYAAFSLGQSQLDKIVKYIGCQKEHHRTCGFKEEVMELLRKYEIEFNEKYLWD